MPKKNDYSAVILAGGENKRMSGVDKAGLIVNGIPIIQRSIRILKESFSEVLIVTNEKRDYSFEGVVVVKDMIRGVGPLGGIYTGLSHIKNEAGFFVACDMPFLHSELIARLLDQFDREDCDAIVPRHGGDIEPLHAIYRKGLKDSILRSLNNDSGDRSIRNFLKKINVHYLDPGDDPEFQNVFKNINTPEDIGRLYGSCRQDAENN